MHGFYTSVPKNKTQFNFIINIVLSSWTGYMILLLFAFNATVKLVTKPIHNTLIYNNYYNLYIICIKGYVVGIIL